MNREVSTVRRAQNRGIMRVLVKVRNPIETGDAPGEDTMLLRRTRECLKSVEAEAVYYGFHDNRRAAYLVLNVLSIDKLPATVELLCSDWEGGAEFGSENRDRTDNR